MTIISANDLNFTKSISIPDKFCTTDIYVNDSSIWTWTDYYSTQERLEADGIPYHTSHIGDRLVCTRPNGLTKAGDYIRVIYRNAGVYDGKAVDISVTYTFPDNTNLNPGSFYTAPFSCAYSRHTMFGCFGNKIDNNWNTRSMNFKHGFTYYNTFDVTLQYQILDSQTHQIVHIPEFCFTFGSLTAPHEGVMCLDSNFTAYKRNGGLAVLTGGWYKNDGSIEQSMGYGWNTTWVDYEMHDTFWRSCVSINTKGTNNMATFKVSGFPLGVWNAPSLGWVGTHAEPPKKYIIDNNKQVEKAIRNPKDTLTYEVIQEVENLGYFGTGMLPYSDFEMTDTLPNNVEFISAKVVKRKNGTNTTLIEYNGETTQTIDGVGTLSWRDSLKKVSFRFSSNYLNTATVGQKMEYVGESYVLVINTKVKNTNTYTSFDNTATTTICGKDQTTNKVTVDFGVWYVEYDGNGSSNPAHWTGERTQNTVTSSSGMPKSKYNHGVKGKLRKNDFVRAGYTFAGWNTKADGTGTSYSDEYDNVLDWTDIPDGIVTLYAQWTKKFGDETISVVSEETGRPVENVTMKLQRKVNDEWVDVLSKTTASGGEVGVTGLHWFDYRWVMTDVPAGYKLSPNVSWSVAYNDLSFTHSVILYMKHVTITCDATVDCVISGEDAPAFLYHVSGTDVAGVKHEYNVMAQVAGTTKKGTGIVSDAFAGTYKITQIPVSRYQPQTAVNKSHATINGTEATVDVKNYTSAKVEFPYLLVNHGWYSGVDSKHNHLYK